MNKKYNIITPKTDKNGFQDENNFYFVFIANSAEEANKFIMNQMFYGHQYYAEDPETGERFHGTTRGLRSLNSYGA